MFTGLVEDLGTVTQMRRSERGAGLTVKTEFYDQVVLGDSVAVNGACLTITEIGDGQVSFEIMNESLDRTSLGLLAPGDTVNLELAMRVDQRFGGHIVYGHVDAICKVCDIEIDGFARLLTVEVPTEQLRYIVEKGSICLDGVSLTVAAVDERTVTVALIPETLTRTTLGAASDGSVINLEVDIMAKHLEKMITTSLNEAADEMRWQRLLEDEADQ